MTKIIFIAAIALFILGCQGDEYADLQADLKVPVRGTPGDKRRESAPPEEASEKKEAGEEKVLTLEELFGSYVRKNPFLTIEEEEEFGYAYRELIEYLKKRYDF